MAQVHCVTHDIDAQRRTPDARVADLATRQHGVVAGAQLRALGLGRGAIQHRVRSGRLHPVHRGVYAVGHRNIGREGFLTAAVLACGRETVLSYRTATDHWGLVRSASPVIHVTVPSSTRLRPRGVIVHQTRQLTGADWTMKDGIPVTSVPRTLIDFAAVASRRELVRAIEQAQRLRLFDMRAIQELLRRSRGRRGASALRAAVAELEEEAPDTRSPLEDRFLDFCRERRIELPALNVVIAGFCVDAAWPSKKVVVELDSRTHHSGIHAFEDDRRRDTKLQVAGFQIVRITDRRLTREADELEADLRSLFR